MERVSAFVNKKSSAIKELKQALDAASGPGLSLKVNRFKVLYTGPNALCYNSFLKDFFSGG